MLGKQFFSAVRKTPILTGAVCVAFVALIGLADYLSGYERSILVVYLVPISLAALAGGVAAGAIVSALSIGTSMVSDVFAGIPTLRLWDAAMGFTAYLIFTWILVRWRDLVTELDERVAQRTAALQAEVEERELLERKVASVTERERRRLGQDLHDTLCQHLAGTSLLAHALTQRLDVVAPGEATEAKNIVGLIDSALDMGHDMARGLFSPTLEANGLASALEALAAETGNRDQLRCIFDGDSALALGDSGIATALYRIAREAVTNASKHAQAHQIRIQLHRREGILTLVVLDDGKGIDTNRPDTGGLGLQMMAYGAHGIGGKLTVDRRPEGGTSVTCIVPDVEG